MPNRITMFPFSVLSRQCSVLSVQFCVGGCCTRAGAREALESLLDSLRAEGALGRVSVIPVDCMDMCEDGPICRLLPDRKTARRVSPTWAARLGKDLARDRRGPEEPGG